MMAEQTIDWSLRWKMAGRQEGEASMLVRLLTHRFGSLPTEVTTRLSSATTEQLEAWSLNVLDAQTLDEVFNRS